MTSERVRSARFAASCLGVLVLFVLDLIVVSAKEKRLYEHQDTLSAARCEAKCWNRRTHKSYCIKQCLASHFVKFGDCPTLENISPFDAACLEACHGDYQCPETSKCCKHQCGVTCQPAKGLHTVAGLPPIPSGISVSERRRRRTLIIRWNSNVPSNIASCRTIYVLEERHHAGRHFSESRLGAWTPRHKTTRTTALLRNLVKPGRWYQFRVAAVNENGTRGWSNNSIKFITSLGPRPPAAPPNMTIGPLYASSDGNLSGELQWNAPNSDLPIQRYKVFWSRRLHGATALNSVLVQHQTIPKDQTRFELKNLQANSLYFLQVQALAQFGKERLKGEKAALLLNTTNYTNITDSPNSAALITDNKMTTKLNDSSTKIEGLHVQKIFWNHDSLYTRIAWKKKKYFSKFTVTWWAGPCQFHDKKVSSHLQMAVTTKATHFDIFNLDFNCRYRVSVREVTSEGLKSVKEASIIFTTPSCLELSLRLHKNKPNCSLH